MRPPARRCSGRSEEQTGPGASPALRRRQGSAHRRRRTPWHEACCRSVQSRNVPREARVPHGGMAGSFASAARPARPTACPPAGWVSADAGNGPGRPMPTAGADRALGVAMSAGTIAGDRIRSLAGPAPTPRVPLRPPSGFAVSFSILVPARSRCHWQASPRPCLHRGQPPRSTPCAPGPVAGPSPKAARGILQRSR